jgi:hypothetical protein
VAEEAYRPVPKSWRQAKNALLAMSFAAWTFMAAVIALAGWGTRSALHQNFGLGLLGFGFVVAGITVVRSKVRMKSMAARSLQARADLEGVELAPTMEGTLVVFDVTRDRVREFLSEPSLSNVVDAASIEKHLEASGEELFELARRHARLRADEERLQGQSETHVVGSALATSAEQKSRIEDAAGRIADELQTLQSKVDATRSLARSVTRGDAETERLREASRELDATAAAIRELAQVEQR